MMTSDGGEGSTTMLDGQRHATAALLHLGRREVSELGSVWCSQAWSGLVASCTVAVESNGWAGSSVMSP